CDVATCASQSRQTAHAHRAGRPRPRVSLHRGPLRKKRSPDFFALYVPWLLSPRGSRYDGSSTPINFLRATLMDADTAPVEAKAPPRWTPIEALERRVLGVLVEKAKTTPENYPLSLNALKNGCNQKNNRAPLMAVEEDQVDAALEA